MSDNYSSNPAPVNYAPQEGMYYDPQVCMYNVICNNRVQLHTHNKELALRYAGFMLGHVVVETTNFELIAEFLNGDRTV